MYKAIVFAGTTEGYAICNFLAENGVSVYACAATEYGGSLLKENEFLHVSAGRLKTEDMEELFHKAAPEIVLDATHPYAAEVTKNIRKACENASTWVPLPFWFTSRARVSYCASPLWWPWTKTPASC